MSPQGQRQRTGDEGIASFDLGAVHLDGEVVAGNEVVAAGNASKAGGDDLVTGDNLTVEMDGAQMHRDAFIAGPTTLAPCSGPFASGPTSARRPSTAMCREPLASRPNVGAGASPMS